MALNVDVASLNNKKTNTTTTSKKPHSFQTYNQSNGLVFNVSLKVTLEKRIYMKIE